MGQEHFHLEKSEKHSVATTKYAECHSQELISDQEYVGVEKTFLNELISKRYGAYSNRLLLALIIPACVLLLLISYLYFHNNNWNKEISVTDVTNTTERIPTDILMERTNAHTKLFPSTTTQPPVTDPLELVILLDRSSQIVLQEMPRLVTLLDTLSKYHNQAKYGLAFYSDFQCTDWWGTDSNHCNTVYGEGGQLGHNDPEGCYTFTTGLTNDIDKIKNKVQSGSIKYLSSGIYESGIAALMMTATDKRMGWTNSKKKVILVITDDATHHWSKNTGIKNPPKGDGSDRCETMDNPTIEFTGSVLEREGISLFLLLSNRGSHVDAFKSWKEVATKMRIIYSIVNMMESVELIGKKFEMLLAGNDPLLDYIY